MSCVWQADPPDLTGIPVGYCDLRAVFSKSRAASLPPHRPYDCAIDLLPGTSPSKGWLYSLSGPEKEAMDQYIWQSLQAGLILFVPDPESQFIVEVDASDVGVGAVLSQRSLCDGKVHPCAFFSHRLSPTVRNYDIGNKELLAEGLALGKWRHWLEGSAQPFLVWTDHKNLKYICSAKRLSSRQACWALFFGRFNFNLLYRPGSKNVKPDSLSRLFGAPEREQKPSFLKGWWSGLFLGVWNGE